MFSNQAFRSLEHAKSLILFLIFDRKDELYLARFIKYCNESNIDKDASSYVERSSDT